MRHVIVVVISLLGYLFVAPPGAATAAGGLTFDQPVEVSSTMVRLSGRAPSSRRTVILQQRVGGQWVREARLKVSNRRYQTRVRIPATAQKYRTVAGSKVSRVRTVQPAAAPPLTTAAPTPVRVPPPAPADECGAAVYGADGQRRQCTFADDFNGSTLDAAKWVVQQTAISGYTSGEGPDCYVSDPANVAVSGGNLLLSAHIHATPFTCKSPLGNFTTKHTNGSVVSWEKFSQAYGRFEFRAKFPATTAPGVHSALWLYPQNHTYGGWPHSGEIDVAEWFSGSADHVYPSVHYSGENVLKSTGYDCLVSKTGTAYHTYAVEWTKTIMKFYYDGRLCFQHSWTPDAPLTGAQPFDQPFMPVMTQALGGAWNGITSATPKSVTMSVDWVRVWK